MDSNESVISVAKHDQSQKISFLSNNGMIISMHPGIYPRSFQIYPQNVSCYLVAGATKCNNSACLSCRCSCIKM